MRYEGRLNVSSPLDLDPLHTVDKWRVREGSAQGGLITRRSQVRILPLLNQSC